MNEEKKSVLIAENDGAVLDALSSQFKKRGIFTITAQDGFDAYSRACKESPGLIIAEINIPLINGYRLSKLLKFDERYNHIPIILTTGKAITKDNDMYESCSANDIIQKPFRFQSLLDLISTITST